MVTDVNQTYCDDHFAVQTSIDSLCYTPETNMLYVNYTSVFKKAGASNLIENRGMDKQAVHKKRGRNIP